MPKLNIYHRKDNRWEGRIPVGKRENGTRKYQYVLGRTKEAVAEKMMQIYESEYCSGKCSKTIADLFHEWHQSIQHRVKESTIANYEMKANKHILPMFGDKFVEMLRAEDIYQFISNKQNAGLSNRYIADIIILVFRCLVWVIRFKV